MRGSILGENDIQIKENVEQLAGASSKYARPHSQWKQLSNQAEMPSNEQLHYWSMHNPILDGKDVEIKRKHRAMNNCIITICAAPFSVNMAFKSRGNVE